MKNATIEHIIPIITSKDAEDQKAKIVELNELKNLKLLCLSCNCRKGGYIYQVSKLFNINVEWFNHI